MAQACRCKNQYLRPERSKSSSGKASEDEGDGDQPDSGEILILQRWIRDRSEWNRKERFTFRSEHKLDRYAPEKSRCFSALEEGADRSR